MIPVGLAATTASALLGGLRGHTQATPQGSAALAAQQFGAQLDALVPGAGSALNSVTSLGQDLLGTLGLGASTSAQTDAGSAAKAYVAADSLR